MTVLDVFHRHSTLSVSFAGANEDSNHGETMSKLKSGMIYEISLCTGAGGGLLASIKLGWEPIFYCEIDEARQEMLRQRIRDGCIPDAPIESDLRKIPKRMLDDLRRFSQKEIVIITAGLPCQPASVAGKRKGEEDERWLWWDAIRILRHIQPQYALFENPPGIASIRHGDGELSIYKILAEIHSAGFDAEWATISAKECGAQHIRKRVFILANSRSKQKARKQIRKQGRKISPFTRNNSEDEFANANCKRYA